MVKMAKLRQAVVSVVGHVDHGKTSILDQIRGTAIVSGEAGAITQAIGASIIPLNTIKSICGNLLDALKIKFTLPGLLFIDTPGHAAFVNLRKRGGNLADMAILVVDINEGFKPQTLESIEILQSYKTPFIIAANKIDLISGFQKHDTNLIKSINNQAQNFQQELDKKIYEIVGKLSEFGFNSERFDRVSDYTKQVAIIPLSAKLNVGIPELLMVLTGLAQNFLEKNLEVDVTGPAKGIVLEIKEETGLGTTVDTIIYDGILKVNDNIVIGSLAEPIVTKVRSLLEPLPLTEMRDKKAKYKKVDHVTAATGVKISAPMLDGAVAGMPLRVANDNVEQIKKQIEKEVGEVVFATEKKGIVVKADSLGSLEALTNLLKEKEIPIKKASIGGITKKDIAEAEANLEDDHLNALILGFNIEPSKIKTKAKVIINDVIYKIIEDLEKWKEEMIKSEETKEIGSLVKPAKVQIMKGYVFRQNNPAVVGVTVLDGEIRVGMPLMKADGKEITQIKSIQADQKSIEKAEKDKQVAISLPKVTVGRQISEGDILYSAVSQQDFRKLKELKHNLSSAEIEILKEIAIIMRKDNSMWGV